MSGTGARLDRGVNRLLRWSEWTGLPGKVAFVACLADLTLLALLGAAGDLGAGRVALYIGFWVLVTIALCRLVRRPLPGPSYVLAVGLLALVEETAAYSIGGGLHGTATSLPQDWVRSVPTFVGLALALWSARRWLGLRASEAFVAAAAAGWTIELLLGGGASPVALIAFGGPVAWIYGSLLVLPQRDLGARRSPPILALGTIGLLIGGTLLAFVVGVALQSGLGL